MTFMPCGNTERDLPRNDKENRKGRKETMHFRILLTMAMLLVFAASSVVAQDFPSKRVTLLVVYGAGGGTDASARLIQPYLEEQLGVPVVVQNSPGGGTEVATTIAARQAADGYTVLVTDQPALNLTLSLREPNYSLEEFTPLTFEVRDPRIFLVRADSPFDSLSEFVEYARENPGELSISVTQGGGQHILASWLVENLDLDVGVVGYSSGGAARTALLNNQVTASIADDFSGYALRDQTKALAIASDSKSNERWPEAETLNNQLEGYGLQLPSPAFMARFMMYAVRSDVKEQYPERYEILQDAFLAAAADPEYQARVEELGASDLTLWISGDELEELQEQFARELELLREMVESGQIGL